MVEQRKRNIEIEVLRAIAVLMVVFHHRNTLIFWPSDISKKIDTIVTFWPGVDLFFVISGFVISKDIVPKLTLTSGRTFKERRGDLFAFWVRRAFRLWPLAWLWLGVYLIGSIFFNHSGAWSSFEINLSASVAAFFQYFNFWEYSCNKNGGCSAMGVYWSLSLEEQFYLLYPFAIYFLGALLPIIALPWVLLQVCMKRSVWSLWWAVRTDALLSGALIYFLEKYKIYTKVEPTFLNRSFLLKGVTLLVVLGAVIVLPCESYGIQRATGYVAVLCAILVWLASYQKRYILGTGRLCGLSLWLASRSYAIYLAHSPVFRFVHEASYGLLNGELPSFAQKILIVLSGVILTGLLSEFSHRLVESPLRKYGRMISDSFIRKVDNQPVGLIGRTDIQV